MIESHSYTWIHLSHKNRVCIYCTLILQCCFILPLWCNQSVKRNQREETPSLRSTMVCFKTSGHKPTYLYRISMIHTFVIIILSMFCGLRITYIYDVISRMTMGVGVSLIVYLMFAISISISIKSVSLSFFRMIEQSRLAWKSMSRGFFNGKQIWQYHISWMANCVL